MEKLRFFEIQDSVKISGNSKKIVSVVSTLGSKPQFLARNSGKVFKNSLRITQNYLKIENSTNFYKTKTVCYSIYFKMHSTMEL